jgi:hypothetical protein
MERLVCRRGDRCRFNEVNGKPPIIKRPLIWVYHISYEHPIHPIIANTSHRGLKNNLTISTTQGFREGLIFAYSYIVFRCESIFWISLPVTLLLFQDDPTQLETTTSGVRRPRPARGISRGCCCHGDTSHSQTTRRSDVGRNLWGRSPHLFRVVASCSAEFRTVLIFSPGLRSRVSKITLQWWAMDSKIF